MSKSIAQAAHGPFGHICATQTRKWCHFANTTIESPTTNQTSPTNYHHPRLDDNERKMGSNNASHHLRSGMFLFHYYFSFIN
jgi:hypothetical protein